MNVKFKFELDHHVTAFDGQEGIVENLCYGKDGIFYRLKIDTGLMNTHKNYFESELLLGWNLYSHERENDLAG